MNALIISSFRLSFPYLIFLLKKLITDLLQHPIHKYEWQNHHESRLRLLTILQLLQQCRDSKYPYLIRMY